MATPPPIVSSRYFTDVGEPACLKVSLLLLVTSVNVTVDGAVGPAGKGVFGNASTLYERPICGVGLGEGIGVCAAAALDRVSSDPASSRITVTLRACREKASREQQRIVGLIRRG